MKYHAESIRIEFKLSADESADKAVVMFLLNHKQTPALAPQQTNTGIEKTFIGTQLRKEFEVKGKTTLGQR